MAKAKTKAAGTNLPVPQNDAEAERMIAQLGVLQRDLVEAKAHHAAAVAALETEWAKVLQASQESQRAITEGLAIWALAHRERLTGGGRTKTVQLPTGTILWREGRFAVKHRGLKIEDVIGAVTDQIKLLQDDLTQARREKRGTGAIGNLKNHLAALKGFLRIKVELNKDAMLAERNFAATVPGVAVLRGAEEFAVEPLASQIREVA